MIQFLTRFVRSIWPVSWVSWLKILGIPKRPSAARLAQPKSLTMRFCKEGFNYFYRPMRDGILIRADSPAALDRANSGEKEEIKLFLNYLIQPVAYRGSARQDGRGWGAQYGQFVEFTVQVKLYKNRAIRNILGQFGNLGCWTPFEILLLKKTLNVFFQLLRIICVEIFH